MKRANDPRHQARRVAVQTLFAWSFVSHDPKQLLSHILEGVDGQVDHELTQNLTRGTIDNLSQIDTLIIESAPEWPLAQIAKIDLTILRLSIYELAVASSVPPKVAIDEAVELAKEFGGDQSGSFVNGVLGTVVKLIDKDNQ